MKSRICVLLALVSLVLLAACETTPLQPKHPNYGLSTVDEAISRMPVLASGIRYHCERIDMAKAIADKDAAFRDIVADAQVLRKLNMGLLDVLRSAARPDDPRALKLVDNVVEAANRLEAAGRAINFSSVKAAADDTSAAVDLLTSYLKEISPTLAKAKEKS